MSFDMYMEYTLLIFLHRYYCNVTCFASIECGPFIYSLLEDGGNKNYVILSRVMSIVYYMTLNYYIIKKNAQPQIETDVPKRRNYMIRNKICIVLTENIMIKSFQKIYIYIMALKTSINLIVLPKKKLYINRLSLCKSLSDRVYEPKRTCTYFISSRINHGLNYEMLIMLNNKKISEILRMLHSKFFLKTRLR